ncbi:MAG: hypothetical protein Q8N47_13440 [Bryobacterales bacterium]|nr:hypothetical protein [Bryobacterales bacterium]
MALDLGRDIVFRGDGAAEGLLERFRQAGAAAVVFATPNAAQRDACRKLSIQALGTSELQFLSWQQVGRAKPETPVVLTEGLWPGVARGEDRSRDEGVASASRQPWVDANGYWIACLRALAPQRPAVLGYLPDQKAGLTKDRVVPFDSLELALADAWAWGGNCLLTPEPRFRVALAAGDAQAAAAWSRFARTAAWLRKNVEWFRQPAVPVVSALVEPGTESAELANLMYRQAVSPALASAFDPPPANPGRILVLVAAGINAPRIAVRGRILAHASQGATVVVDAPAGQAWWRVKEMRVAREEEDRVFHKLGRGLVVAYRKPVEDPSEFALDVIDLVTHKKRAVRMWNAPAVLALVTQARLVLVNYGSPQDQEFTVHVQGLYHRARLERPEAGPLDLQPTRRGSATELRVPGIDRVAVVELRT